MLRIVAALLLRLAVLQASKNTDLSMTGQPLWQQATLLFESLSASDNSVFPPLTRLGLQECPPLLLL